MAVSRKIRWSLIAAGAIVCVIIAPFLLIFGSNLGSGILSLILDRTPTTAELTGYYEYRAPWGAAQLRINSDGTFQEQIAEKGKSAKLYSGQWEASRKENYLEVGFKPFGMVWDDQHGTTTQGFGTAFFKPRAGKTYGVVDDDLGERFEKE